MKRFFASVGAAAALLSATAGDVFSDAASWRRGFVGEGLIPQNSTTAFPEALRLGDAASVDHATTVNGNYNSGGHGIVLRQEEVVFPYANVTQEQTVAYFEQNVYAANETTDYLRAAALDFTAPFVISNASDVGYTLFVRFRWDGTCPTNALNQFYFLKAAFAYSTTAYKGSGFEMGVTRNGNYYVYAGNQGYTATFTAPADKWNDCAVVVRSGKMTVYAFCQDYYGGFIKTWSVTLPNTALNPEPTSAAIRLGGEMAYGWNGGGAYSWDANAWKVFRGSVQSFAAWPRALSLDEVRQVFAWPRTDLVRLGTVNGSALEFAGGASAATDARAQDGWANMPASLTADSPSVAIAFNVPAEDAGLAQLLRVTGAGAASGSLAVSVNGAAVGALAVSPGRTSLRQLNGGLFAAGANTLTLTRLSGTVTFDALALGGSFQIGMVNNGTGEFVQEHADYLNYDTMDGNWKHVARAVRTPASDSLSRHTLHVWVPDEVAGREGCQVRVTTSVKPYPAAQTLSLSANGTKLATGTFANPSVFTPFSATVPATLLTAGRNTFTVASEEETASGYVLFDYFRIETLLKTGLVLQIK